MSQKITALCRKINGFLSVKNGVTYSSHWHIYCEGMRNFTKNMNENFFF